MANSTPIADPKDALVQLFKKAGIKRVAYIDDKFSIENLKEEFIGNLKALKIQKDIVPELDFIDWGKPSSIFGNVIEQAWNEIKEPQTRYNYLQRIYEYQEDKESLVNIFPVTGLKEIAPEYVETFSPEEWEKGKDTFFEDALKKNSDRVLCLFDMELKTPDRDGIYYLKDTLSNPKSSKKTYCAIFSHLITIGEEYFMKKEWCSSHSINKDIAKKFYPISKSSYSETPLWSFIEGIKNVLIVNEVEQLKQQSKLIIKTAHKKVIDEIAELTPETYNHIIQRSSKDEGIWEMNTLFRVSNIMQDHALKTSISSQEVRGKFNISISKIRSFEEIEVENKPSRIGNQAMKLRENELIENDEIINQLHFPLSNGDIFKIGNKEYILLAQPCNLTIRSDGKRGFNFSMANLILLSSKGEQDYFEKLPIDIDEFKFLNFSNHLSIRLDILDLAVFNENGDCSINLKVELEKTFFHLSLRNRYKYIKKELLECAQTLDLFHKGMKTSKEYKEICRFLKPSISLNKIPGINQNPYILNSLEFKFGIKRVKRLKEPYSTDLLQKFMLYQSRNAFERDYSLKE